MNSPFNEVFPTPGLKGPGDYEPDTKATPGGMNSPFQEGPPAFHESRGVPVKFKENIPASPAGINTPFGTAIDLKK